MKCFNMNLEVQLSTDHGQSLLYAEGHETGLEFSTKYIQMTCVGFLFLNKTHLACCTVLFTVTGFSFKFHHVILDGGVENNFFHHVFIAYVRLYEQIKL